MSYRSQTEENESEFMTFVNKTDQITLYAKLSFSFIRFEKKNNRKLIEIFLVFLDGNRDGWGRCYRSEIILCDIKVT